MRIPMKVDYGVRALVELAQRNGNQPVRTAEIAKKQHIPEPYLDQVLTALNKFGFIHSRRGPSGGHVLAKPPEEISLGDIMAKLEGRNAPLDCIEQPSECTLSAACAQREVWQSVEDAIEKVLNMTSIANLASRQKMINFEEARPWSTPLARVK
jgi:Rrf2 family protein